MDKSRYVLDGIVPILQTPFAADGMPDVESLRRLMDHVIQAGAAGMIYPAVASEVHKLTPDERRAMVEIVLDHARGRVPVFVGVSAASAEESLGLARHAATHGAAGILAQAPEAIRTGSGQLRAYFRTLARGVELPLMIQDLDWRGGGMPEGSMVAIYRTIMARYTAGDRESARRLFERLLPVLAFANQHIDVSVQFFKRVLVAKGIFRTHAAREPILRLDDVQEQIAAGLVDRVLALERDLA